MAASEEAASLRQAIMGLYGMAGVSQQQANQWLNAFSQTPAAWEACLQLLDVAERPEVCFFCANMLLSKVRSEWHKLTAEQQGNMGTMISNKFQSFLGHAQAKLAMQRLGLLLAAVASLSGAQACQTFAGQCLGMISGGEGGQYHMAECALTMLTALADEINNMDKARRTELVAATSRQWTDVAGLATGFIPTQMAAGNYGLVHGALLCMQSWSKLSADASSTCRMSPGQLAASHPQLLGCLFALVGATASEPVTAERIETLAAELLCELLGPGTYGTDAQQERAAVEAAMSALLALRDAALAPGPAGAGVARCVASIASALAQRDTAAVCGCGADTAPVLATAGLPPASNGATANGTAAGSGHHVIPLAQLLVQCITRPERDVCEAATEYFLCVNSLPVRERHQQMAEPLYSSLILPLLRGHACYPPTFTGWYDQVDEDEEAFHRFRDQSLSELLETVYLMTGPLLLQQIQHSIATASSWQQAEGALFCLRAVAPALKGGRKAHLESSPHGQQVQQLLQELIEDLCSPNSRAAAFLGSPYTCATAATLIGSYSSLFDTAHSLLEGALRLLLHALCFSYSWREAAGAFKALCLRCASHLADRQVLQSLAGVAAVAVAPVPPAGQMAVFVDMPLEDRQAVVEGLTRVITFMGDADAMESALGLQQPHLARAQAIITHGSSTAAQGGGAAKQLLKHLADELQLMAALIKGMEFPAQAAAGAAHPAMKLLEAAWPVLTAVSEAPVCQRDPLVVQAVCEVYKRAVQTARGAAKPLLTTLLKAVGELFTASHQAACLSVLGTITEVFGEVRNAPDIAAAQQQALEGAVSAAGAVLVARTSSGQPLSESGDLLVSLLAVADAHLVFAREQFFSSSVLPPVFNWAIAAAGLREKEPAHAAFSFLSHLLAAASKIFAATADTSVPSEQQASVARAATMLHQCIAAQGEKLVRTLVLAACDTAPRQLLRALSNVLYQLVQGSAVSEAGAAWLLKVLQEPQLPGMAAGLLKTADCELFAKLSLRQPALPRGRFDALLIDFAAVARGEGTSDALLAYEL